MASEVELAFCICDWRRFRRSSWDEDAVEAREATIGNSIISPALF